MNKIIILGHKNPDVDSIVSGYLLEKILNSLGINSEFIIPDKKIEQENLDICRANGLDPIQFQKNINLEDPNTKYILVDHNERDVKGEIIAVIDHHPTDKEFNLKHYYNNHISATACYISMLYEIFQLFTKYEIQNVSTTEAQKELLNKLKNARDIIWNTIVNSEKATTELEKILSELEKIIEILTTNKLITLEQLNEIIKLQSNKESILDANDYKLAVVASMVDTASFNSTKGRKEDKVWATNICKEYSLDYNVLYLQGLCLTNLEDLDQASLNGSKEYKYGTKKVESSYIQIENPTQIKEEINTIIEKLKLHIEHKKLDAFVFIVHNMSKFETMYYLITKNGIIERYYDNYTSRGSTIMPEIKDFLETYKPLTKKKEI